MNHLDFTPYPQYQKPITNSGRRLLLQAKPIPKQNESLFNQPIHESLNYDPRIGAIGSPVSSRPNSVDADNLPDGMQNPFDTEEPSLLGDIGTDSVDVFDTSAKSDDDVFTDDKSEKGLIENNVPNHVPVVFGITDGKKPVTKADAIKAHIKQNSVFYGNLFYNDDYVNSLKKIESLEFLDYFYPSFKLMNFISRTSSAVGGLANDTEFMDKYISLESDTTEKATPYIEANYNKASNWYKVAYSDPKHVVYCCRLYKWVKYVLSVSGNGVPKGVSDSDYDAFVYEWRTMIEDHHNAMANAKEYSTEYFKHAQALHDLMWDPLDDPNSVDVQATNIISFASMFSDSITKIGVHTISESNDGEMVKKEDVYAWLKKELDPSALKPYYLLPDQEKYLILDPSMIKYAMANITHVDPEDRNEYAENLNRLYNEFRPNISLSVDHPYAKYINAGKHKITPDEIIVPIIEGVIEDNTDEAEEKNFPQHYRIVKMDYYDSDVMDLDPDHKKHTKGED